MDHDGGRLGVDEGDSCGAAARRALCRTMKARARRYEQRPAALDMLHPGLSAAAPAALVAIGEHLVERERRSPRRWFGFGGEIGLLNAQAALLLGRLRRRQDARAADPGAARPDGVAPPARAIAVPSAGREEPPSRPPGCASRRVGTGST